MTLDVALGVLQLSHKYQIQGLQQRMKLRLQEDWPLKDSDYLARLTFLGSPEFRVVQAAKVIDVAQRCQVHELLPPAFYELHCARGTKYEKIAENLSLENTARLWLGHARVDKRLRSLVDSDCSAPIRISSSGRQQTITIAEYRKTFNGCSESPKPYARSSCICPSLFLTFRPILAQRLLDGTSGLTVLQQFRCEELKGVCDCCRVWFKKVLEYKIQELWESIPTDFDLPPIDSKLYSKIRILGQNPRS